MKNEGFTPPKIWVIAPKNKVVGSHGRFLLAQKVYFQGPLLSVLESVFSGV